MAKVNRRYTFPKRRKKEGKTNYRKRLALLKSENLRFVVRRSSNNIVAQLVRYEITGDKVLASASSQELKKHGWTFTKNMPSAYLVGFLLACKAKKQKAAGQAVMDTGFFTPVSGSRIFGVAKGAVEGGLNLVHSPEGFPSDERVRGEHIAEYAKAGSANKTQFTKHKGEASKLPELFEKTKTAITNAVK